MNSGENLDRAQETASVFPQPREKSFWLNCQPQPHSAGPELSLPCHANPTGKTAQQFSSSIIPFLVLTLHLGLPTTLPEGPSSSHLGAFVSGAGVGPTGAGPEGVSSGLWAEARSSTSSASIGSRGGTSLSTASDV